MNCIKARLEHERVLAKGRQINIVFVIDAGYGMNTYADAIKTSISNLVAAKENIIKKVQTRINTGTARLCTGALTIMLA